MADGIAILARMASRTNQWILKMKIDKRRACQLRLEGHTFVDIGKILAKEQGRRVCYQGHTISKAVKSYIQNTSSINYTKTGAEEMVETPKSERRLITAQPEITDEHVRIFGGEIKRPRDVTVAAWRKVWEGIVKMPDRGNQ